MDRVPYAINFFATLNSASSRRLIVYIPKAWKCPMELSTYSA